MTRFAELVEGVLHDTFSVSLGAFRPELVLCATIVVLLLARMIVPRWRTSAFYIMVVGTAVALWLVLPGNWHAGTDAGTDKGTVPFSLSENWDSPRTWDSPPAPIFTGMLVSDSFSIIMRGLLLLFALLFTTFTQVAGVPEPEDATEFYVLVLGALLGMCLMVSANHMLIVLLGVEMASVPSYVLAGILRHRRQSTEAALKYAVFGAGTAGVMLYGISLLAGVLGSAHLPTMTVRLADMSHSGAIGPYTMVLVLGGLMVMVGLAFKLSAVPFHFWAPDVFEGAPAEVGTFLSIASKAAALALLVRLALGFAYVDREAEKKWQAEIAPAPASVPAADASAMGPPEESIRETLDRAAASIKEQIGSAGTVMVPQSPERPLLAALGHTREYIVGLLSLLAAVTCTFGNLAAYGQTNMKRLLAYSTIAHAGYMMMPVVAAVAISGRDPDGARFAVASLVVYIAIYLFMNLGAFAVTAFLRNALGSENIADYAGLVRRSPALVVCAAIILFSLVGLPPLAGFFAKFFIFGALVNSGLYLLLVIGGLNTVLSLFYYLRVVRVMTLQPEPAGRPAPSIPLWSAAGAYCALITVPLIALFVWSDTLIPWAEAAASSLLR